MPRFTCLFIWYLYLVQNLSKLQKDAWSELNKLNNAVKNYWNSFWRRCFSVTFENYSSWSRYLSGWVAFYWIVSNSFTLIIAITLKKWWDNVDELWYGWSMEIRWPLSRPRPPPNAMSILNAKKPKPPPNALSISNTKTTLTKFLTECWMEVQSI